MRCSVLLALGLLLAACGAAEEQPPGPLDRDLFTELLLEAQLIEARINHELVVQHISEVAGERYYDELFREKGVTRAEFEETFAWYNAHPLELKAVYEAVGEELMRRKDMVRQ